jgi:hypothetical protein
LREVSSLDTPPDSLAVFAWDDLDPRPDGRVLVLDRVQDPGNAGTLLRMADWFGVAYILHTTGTVDFGNPKTVQASMGSLARVPVRYATESEAITLLQSEGRPIVMWPLWSRTKAKALPKPGATPPPPSPPSTAHPQAAPKASMWPRLRRCCCTRRTEVASWRGWRGWQGWLVGEVGKVGSLARLARSLLAACCSLLVASGYEAAHGALARSAERTERHRPKRRRREGRVRL